MSPMMKAYYATGKRVMIDNVPCWRPKWWGELGNDKEYRRVTRDTYNKAHYPPGTIRVVRNGIPFRFAAHVARWKPSNKAALCQGSDPFGLTTLPHPKGKLEWEAPTVKAFRERYGYKVWEFSYRRREAEYDYKRIGWQSPPDLFVWARWQHKIENARARSAHESRGV